MTEQARGLPFDPASLKGLSETLMTSLGGDGLLPAPMVLALASSFDSVERWRGGFVTMALEGGSGWIVLSYLPHDGTLVNQWAFDDTQNLTAGVPILALDMHEQAYHADFGANAAAYLDRCLQSVNWAAVAARYARAVHDASEGLGARAGAVGQARVLDVRRAGVFEQATERLPGSQWRDPELVGQWMADVPRGCEVAVYCVHGHEVSRNIAVRLRANGINARFLEGGIHGWLAAGLPLVRKEEESMRS